MRSAYIYGHAMNDANAETLLTDLFACSPDAVGRLKLLHPAFDPEVGRNMGVPADASLGDMARAADLPLTAVLAAARGVVAVPELCGCSSKKGGGGCGGGETRH